MTKRYFHIQRLNGIRKEWFENETVLINSSDLNNYYSDLINSTGQFYTVNNRKLDLTNYAKHKYKHLNSNETFESYEKENLMLFNKVEEYKILVNDLHENLVQYLKWIREEIFENERKTNFQDLPSRKSCLWISELESLNKWWKMFENSDNKKIIEIQLTENSKIHYADGYLIKSETLEINKYKELAKSYWLGEINHKTEKEILLEGNFKVIGEYRNLEEALSSG